MKSNNYTGTLRLLRLNLRRDWLKSIWWLIGLVGLSASAAAKFDGLYGTAKAISAIIITLRTPAMVALFGPFSASKPYTVANIYAAEMMVFMGLFMAMMNIYFAIHATRADEDSGVAELIRAHAVGHNATLLVAIIQLIILNLVAGILEALGLQFSQMSGVTVAGSWLFGIGLAIFGLMFAAFSLFFAQIASSARTATILSYSWLGILFIVRMMTDVRNTRWTWFTIYGWIEKLAIFDGNHIAPLGLMLGLTIFVTMVTVMVASKRDLGAGLLPDRVGPQHASILLRGPFTLIARLERTSTLIWLVGMLILGASYGSIFGTVGDLVKTNPALASMLGTSAIHAANRVLVLTLANKLTMIFAILATVPGVMTLLRLNSDERKGYFEQVHARGISRLRLYLTMTTYGLLVAVAALFLGILGMGLMGIASMTAAPHLSQFMRGFWGYLPAVIAAFGISAVLVGILPRWQSAFWIVPIYGFISLYFGGLMKLPKWATQLTPYGWINNVPRVEVNWGNGAWFTLLGLVLLIVGYWAYAHRDLTVN